MAPIYYLVISIYCLYVFIAFCLYVLSHGQKYAILGPQQIISWLQYILSWPQYISSWPLMTRVINILSCCLYRVSNGLNLLSFDFNTLSCHIDILSRGLNILL